jgi:glutamate synthase (NADPH) small chain
MIRSEGRYLSDAACSICPSCGRRQPSALTVAGDLVQKGHKVRGFEAPHELDGVLVYGIAEFRLPKQIIREQLDYLREMDVEFETDVVVGRAVTIDELMGEEGFDAVYIGEGAGLPQLMNIPGELFNGVYSANELLTCINMMKAYKFPTCDEPMLDLQGKDVAVIGGGNTALDANRSALRLGARRAYVIYRRSDAEMLARAEEVHHARQEGIDFQMLTAPIEFISDGKGWLTAARCVRMELGEPDASGRRRPVSLQGSEFDLPLSVAVIAIATSANPIVHSTTPGLGKNNRGYIQANEKTQRSTRQGILLEETL